MKIQKQPDYLIFADSAKNGEVEEFPDIPRGWGTTIDRTESKPPMEWMNGAFQRIDQNILYLLQQGIPEWRENVTYPTSAIIKYRGILYTATSENENANPESSGKWKHTHDSVSNATHTQAGVVKLSSSVDSTSETEAATPKAVRDAYEYARFSDQKAQSAYDHASAAHNRIDPIVDKFQTNNLESRIYSPDKTRFLIVRNDGIVGLFNLVNNQFSWYITNDGWIDGYITASRVGGLDQFVRDRVLPVGIPQPYPTNTPPSRWLECNGAAFDTNQFPKLSAAYPSGILPDLRGVFIRGKDNGRGLDPDRPILSYQDDAIRNIWGQFSVVGRAAGAGPIEGEGAIQADSRWNAAVKGGDRDDWGRIFSFNASRVVPVAHENRPRNVAFIYIVKAE